MTQTSSANSRNRFVSCLCVKREKLGKAHSKKDPLDLFMKAGKLKTHVGGKIAKSFSPIKFFWVCLRASAFHTALRLWNHHRFHQSNGKMLFSPRFVLFFRSRNTNYPTHQSFWHQSVLFSDQRAFEPAKLSAKLRRGNLSNKSFQFVISEYKQVLAINTPWLLQCTICCFLSNVDFHYDFCDWEMKLPFPAQFFIKELSALPFPSLFFCLSYPRSHIFCAIL